jgi:multidrug transporter EmrE-like cation transporter
MRIYFYIFIVAILVAYSQLVVKWRVLGVADQIGKLSTILDKGLFYLTDPYILSGYIIALLASFLWLFVVSKISLSIGFPIYIGCCFMLVILGSKIILNENLSTFQQLAVFFIFIGIAIGSIE